MSPQPAAKEGARGHSPDSLEVTQVASAFSFTWFPFPSGVEGKVGASNQKNSEIEFESLSQLSNFMVLSKLCKFSQLQLSVKMKMI